MHYWFVILLCDKPCLSLLYVNLYLLKSGSDFILPCVVLFLHSCTVKIIKKYFMLCYLMLFYFILFLLLSVTIRTDLQTIVVSTRREIIGLTNIFHLIRLINTALKFILTNHIIITSTTSLTSYRLIITASVFLLWAMPSLALVPTPALTISCP